MDRIISHLSLNVIKLLRRRRENKLERSSMKSFSDKSITFLSEARGWKVLASWGSTVVEHSPHILKVEGSSPPANAGAATKIDR